MKINIKLDGLIVDTIEEVNGNTLNARYFNHKINYWRSLNLTGDLRIQIPDKIQVIFSDNNDYVIRINGVNVLCTLPFDDSYVIKLPNLNYEFSELNKNTVYEFEGLEFNEVICITSIVKIGKSGCKLIHKPSFKLVGDKIYFKKIFFKEYQSGFMEFSGNTGTSMMELNRKDKSIINKLSPIVMELNKIENRVIPNWIYMNPVEFEFTEFGHLTGKLTRNVRMNNSNNFDKYWKIEAEKLISNLTDLPLITNMKELSKYDVVNPTCPEKGSILTGLREYKSLDDYIESFKISLDIR